MVAFFGPHTVSIEEIVALLLKEVRASVTLGLGEPVNRAVLTCPSFFGARQREALRVAGELAGFHVERVVCGPLAAVVEHTKARIRPSRVMVVDCGAGALDVALIEITPEGYELVGSRGSRKLGGDAYDQLLVRHLAMVTEGLQGAAGLGGFFDIREAAELGKWTLSEQDTAHIEVAHAGDASAGEEDWRLSAEILRSEAEALFEPLVAQSIELCKQVCEEAGWAVESLDNVLPVGGQARIPLLLNRLREVFKGALTLIDAHKTVSFGAARIAERISEGRPLRLGEVIPNSISMGRPKGGLDRILNRGDRLPAMVVRSVRVTEDADLDVFLFEGESDQVSDVEPLMRVTLTNLPSGIESPFTILFSVEMSEEGILRFEAIEQSTGQVVEPIVNAELTPETLGRFLPVSEKRPRARSDSSVFAWLLRRLSRPDARSNPESLPQ